MASPLKRRRAEPIDSEGCEEFTIAVVGSVDSGKSSTVGTLVTGIPDDGNGLSRSIVFVHPHERESGRTSDISYQYLKDSESRKIFTFVDLAGHEAYLKTTISGLTSSVPDLAIVCISQKITQMTKEHIGLCIGLNIPFVIVFTKIDLYEAELIQFLIKETKLMLAKTGRKMIEVREDKDIRRYTGTLIPYILTSNKTGQGLKLLRSIFNCTVKRNHVFPLGFVIENIYNVPGHGIVVSGISGEDIKRGDVLYIGPFSKSDFYPLTVKTIHNDYRFDIPVLHAGKKGCLSVNVRTKNKFDKLRKGMIISKSPQNVCKEFDAQVTIIHHHTTIRDKYQVHINCGTLREQVQFMGMTDLGGHIISQARSGDSIIVRIMFIKNLNYLQEGQQFTMREGSTRGIGVVKRLIPL